MNFDRNYLNMQSGGILMDEIKIREIIPTDYKDIYRLNIQLGYDYDINKTEKRIEYILNNTKDKIIVAEYGHTIIGYIHITPYELMYSDSLINILGFVVEEKSRNKSIGKRLLNEAEAYAKKNNFAGIRLVSGCERINAHAFYEKNGYTNRKNQKNFVKFFE
jgi:ribosomal protein S18 acetylase RimI-like enzyme